MSSLFGRRTELNIAGKLVKSPPMTIEFDLPFSDDAKDNVGTITVYNLSDGTISGIEKEGYLVLKSGYVGDMGVIGEYTVKAVEPSFSTTERILEITVGEDEGSWRAALISETWQPGTLSSRIIKDIVASLGLMLGELTLPVDMQYPRGKSFFKTAKQCLSELVKDCGAKLSFSRGTIYIKVPGTGTEKGLVLNKASGLIGTPEKITTKRDGKTLNGYKVKSLMNYRLEVGSIVRIESRAVTGTFKVDKGAYKSTESEHVVELEVYPL